MAELKSRIKTALDESRILVLGTQVLMGSEFTAVFQSSFSKLPTLSQYLVIGALVLLLVALTFFMSPAPYHQLAEHGEPTERFCRYVTRMIGLALFPFALGLGINLYVATEKLSNPTVGLAAGLAVAALALFFWYGLEGLDRPRHPHSVMSMPSGRQPGNPQAPHEERQHGDADAGDGARPPAKSPAPGGGRPEGPAGGTSIEDRVTHVLTEARVVLPGVQALIGFQFSSMFTDPFDHLPVSSKYVHLSSIGLMAIGMILLMTPASYHRIVEHGESTEHFQRFASRMVLAAMVPLALGISLDFFVVVRKVSDSPILAGAGAAVLLLFFFGFWFGFTLWRRHAEPGPPRA
jgi:hypothetical protein